MMQLVKVPVENEMDLTLAYKKTIKAGDLLGLSLSTRTAFATAVSEVCREVIDKTENGNVSIEVQGSQEPYQMAAVITFLLDKEMGSLEQGLQYARKLIPYFEFSTIGDQGTVELKLSIPRTAKVTRIKLIDVKSYFESAEPTTPYEEVRQRNAELYLINEQSEMALMQSEILNQQKTEFLSVASHELKTPLTILRAFTQMALQGNSHTQTLAHLKKVDIQARKIQTLIQQLLDIAKVENGQAHYDNEQVDFNAYLTNMADLITQLVPEHRLTIELCETRILYIDKIRIEQVLMNIAGNAAKYSAPGTIINISTKISDKGDLVIAVKDEGIGMSVDELQKVFDKFYRVESVVKKYNGFGMGLYISSKIITDHGGELWAESAGSSGSIFKIRLPVIQ